MVLSLFEFAGISGQNILALSSNLLCANCPWLCYLSLIACLAVVGKQFLTYFLKPCVCLEIFFVLTIDS